MTSTEWIRTLKRLIIMYREVYYQERMADELRKDASQIKLEALPDNLPSITKIEKDVADSEHNKNQSWGCMGIALVFMLLAIALSNGFLIVIGVFAIFVALLIVTAASDEQKKAKGHLEWETNEQRKKTDEIQKHNETIKKAYPIEKAILYGEADKFDEAVKQSKAMLSEECDALNLPQRFRGFAEVCSLYQLLCTKKCQTLEDAEAQPDAEIKRAAFVHDEQCAVTLSAQVKASQPVWYNEIIKREELIKKAIEINRNRCRNIVIKQKIYTLYGIEQEVAIQKAIYEVCPTKDDSSAKYANLLSKYLDYILASSQETFDMVCVLKDHDFSLD